ncbi:hypothetical protein [Methanosarcina mazei]|uniref:hypothetical protein n=1 Tax=Methanosarcina mazei TaxID=2209 RepID=UPI00064FEBD5|nr:hypothetical protein [Methanosarcina mazei]
MEYKTVSTKLPRNDFTQLIAHCEKLGVSPSWFLKDLILNELDNPKPLIVSGINLMKYNSSTDLFTWVVQTDDGINHEIIMNISMTFLNDLNRAIVDGLEQRATLIGKVNEDSVAVPEKLLRNDK